MLAGISDRTQKTDLRSVCEGPVRGDKERQAGFHDNNFFFIFLNGVGGQTDRQADGARDACDGVFIIYTHQCFFERQLRRRVHVRAHAGRPCSRAGNDSPPPPGVEPSLSRLLPPHLREPFTSLWLRRGSISIIPISCNHSRREWERQAVTRNTPQHFMHCFCTGRSGFPEGGAGSE